MVCIQQDFRENAAFKCNAFTKMIGNGTSWTKCEDWLCVRQVNH